MTDNSAFRAGKVTIGSRWVLKNYDHPAINDELRAAGEVEVYKLRHDGFIVTVTIIFGEGETEDFELYLFVNIFKHRPRSDELINNLRDYKYKHNLLVDLIADTERRKKVILPVSKDIHWDYGTQDKTVELLVCPKCGIVDRTQTRSVKPMSKFKAFFNKEPISGGKLLLLIVFISVVFIVSEWLNIPVKPGTPAFIVYGVFLLIMLAVIVVDMIRTRAEIKRHTSKYK